MLRIAGFLTGLVLLGSLTGCGGGSADTATFAQGQVVKGVMRNAQVDAYAIRDGQIDSQSLASVSTDNNGHYLFTDLSWQGPLLLKLTTTTQTMMQCELSTGCGENGQIAMGDFYNFHHPQFELKVFVSSLDDFQLITPVSTLAASRIEQQGVLDAESITSINQQTRVYFDLPPQAQDLPAINQLFAAESDQAMESALMAAFARQAAENQSDLDDYLQQINHDFALDGQLAADAETGFSVAELASSAREVLPSGHAAANHLLRIYEQASNSDTGNWRGNESQPTSEASLDSVRTSSQTIKQDLANTLNDGWSTSKQQQNTWREQMSPLQLSSDQGTLLLQLLAAVSSVTLSDGGMTVDLQTLLDTLGIDNAQANGTITASAVGDDFRLLIDGDVTIADSTLDMQLSLLGSSLTDLQAGTGSWQLESGVTNQLTTEQLSIDFSSGQLDLDGQGQFQFSADAAIAQLNQVNPLQFDGSWMLKLQSSQSDLLDQLQLENRLAQYPQMQDLLGATEQQALGNWDRFSGLQLTGQLTRSEQTLFDGEFALLQMSKTQNEQTEKANLVYFELENDLENNNYWLQVMDASERLTVSYLDLPDNNNAALSGSLQARAIKLSDNSWQVQGFSITGQMTSSSVQFELNGNAQLAASEQDAALQVIDQLSLNMQLQLQGNEVLSLQAEQASQADSLTLSALVKIGFLLIRISI